MCDWEMREENKMGFWKEKMGEEYKEILWFECGF